MIELKILGKAEKNVCELFSEVMSDNRNLENEIILFCDYSGFDIPVGYVFKKIIDANSNEFSGELILKSVSQQFARPFDMVPMGWKTICKFEIKDIFLLEILNSLESLNT